MVKVQQNIENSKSQKKRFFNLQKRISNPINSSEIVPLGNYTSYFAKTDTQEVTMTDAEIAKRRYQYKKEKTERKKKIGKKIPRVSYCGVRTIKKNPLNVKIVKGDKGSIYYDGMQRCGSVWFCPDCMYKLMKARSEELYTQLRAYKDKKRTVLFITFTLQHNTGESLESLHKLLLEAFQYANSHRKWQDVKKRFSIEFLRALEVLFGINGWHPHLHCVFVGGDEIVKEIETFLELYKTFLRSRGKLVNNHTVVMEKWNGKLSDMTEYIFKGMLEQEITGGNLKKSNQGKTFFDLIDEGNNTEADEYIYVMKGKRQYHHSKGFFKDVRVLSDQEILTDDKVKEVLYTIPINVYADIVHKGIALHLLNEYEYGGAKRMETFLELYDVDTGFMQTLSVQFVNST